MNRTYYSLNDTPIQAKKLKQQMNDASIITFTGPLGAGKTTLIKEFLKLQGVTDLVTSPTFTYLNIYTNQDGKTFYHFDLYRIETVEQFLEAGFDEYLYQPNSMAIIEWPEKVMPLLKDGVCEVSIDYAPNNTRAITID